MKIEFTFRNPPESLTERQIAANVADLPMPDGWTRVADVALVEGLFKGLRVGEIAGQIGADYDTARERFLQLRQAACGSAPVFTLTAQTALLHAVREAGG